MLIRIAPFSRLFFQAALFAAFVFVFPENTQAFSTPKDVTLQTDVFVQIMDHAEVLSWYTQTKQITFQADKLREFEDVTAACSPFQIFCQGFLSRMTREHIILAHTAKLAPDAIKTSIERFADKANRDPKNARLSVEDSKVTIAVPAENGITVDIEASLKALESELRASKTDALTVKLQSSTTPAKVSSETLSSLGITDLIGTATTDFRGSPKNRVYNIGRAVQEFDGVVIEPGAVFSFVDYLGPRTGHQKQQD
jgi:vancomycin resistance protein YoaR